MKLPLLCLVIFACTICNAQTADRIITAGSAMTETVCALGGQANIVASDKTSLFPPEIQALPSIGYRTNINAEGIVSLKPTLVIAEKDYVDEAVLTQIQSAGVKTIIIKRTYNLCQPINETGLKSRTAELRGAWDELKKSKPAMRIRDCAGELGVSEAELLATTVSDYTTRLEGDWTAFLQRLPELGRVMSLTRNEGCVLEHKGSFQKIDVIAGPHSMATVIGPIETRVFFSPWKYGFAVQQQTPKGLQESLQIFDGAGEAITKIFLLEAGVGNKLQSDVEAYHRIVADFKAVEHESEIEITAARKAPVKQIDEVQQESLLSDWTNLKDTHDFFSMLRKHQVNRLDAVVLADGKFTYRIDKSALVTMLETAAREHLPIMVFAGNPGNLQIHQGKVQTIRVMDQWLNILDPDFNMHLRQDLIESAWVVKKPTTDGVVTGIEVFDADKEMIVQFFGLRKPGIPELGKWTALVETLPRA